MGFLSWYTQELHPKIFVKTLSIFTILRALVLTTLKLLGLSRFVEPEICWPEAGPEFKSVTAALIQEMLPVMKFASVAGHGPGRVDDDPPERCAVCMHEFRGRDEIRRLSKCQHIFHKGCVDRWMEHDQRTCPLCRTSLVPDNLVDALERLEAASRSLPEFGSEFCAINNFS